MFHLPHLQNSGPWGLSNKTFYAVLKKDLPLTPPPPSRRCFVSNATCTQSFAKKSKKNIISLSCLFISRTKRLMWSFSFPETRENLKEKNNISQKNTDLFCLVNYGVPLLVLILTSLLEPDYCATIHLLKLHIKW